MENPNEVPFYMSMEWLYMGYVMPRKNILKFVCFVLMHRVIGFIFIIGGGFMHFVKITKENIDEIDATENIVEVLGGLGVVIGMSITSYLHKEWKFFLKNVMDFSYGKPQNIDKQIKFGNYCSRYLGYCFIGAPILYGIISTLEAPNCNKINEERDLHLMCDTFLPMWFPFEVSKKSYRYVIFVAIVIIQLSSVMISVLPSVLFCFLIYEATEILGLHIENLNDHFRKMISKRDVRCRSDGIGYWIRYHNHILKLSDTFRILVKKSTGHVTMISALVFGCGGAQLIKGLKPLSPIIFLIGWMIPIFLLCHSGERLTNFSLSVHDTVRDSDWYKASPAIQRDVVLILMRSQKTLHLDTLPLGFANYSLFLLMLRTSYSYMMFLKHTI